MRTAARRDDNHADIVAGLRKCGYSVLDLGAVGKGCPDILVGVTCHGMKHNMLMEIKDGEKCLSAQKLTDAQVGWFQTWKGQACVVNSIDQALAAIADKKLETPGGF